ncbi:MAG: GNAT family N-acetyltransferase [Promethearchaeota archaeon]
MLSEEIVTPSVISFDDMFMKFTQQFLQSFQSIIISDFERGTSVNLKIKGRSDKKRINPIIRLARSDDIDEIVFIYKDLYDNTYPYKEMEDREEIQKMLDSPNIEWLIFETNQHEIVGCFTFMFDFDKKLGNIRGFNLKRKFLGKLDIMKMAMGSIITMYKKYNDKIFRWYGECRTAHSKSQYFLSALGFKPVGFYPCKDIFYNKVESDLLILSYDKRALTTKRCTDPPEIIAEALNGFFYSDNRYNLGSYKIADSRCLNLDLNNQKVRKFQKNLIRNISKDKFGYESIRLSFKGSQSFFEFLFTPTVQNFEKTHYKVNCLEELYVFVQEFLNYGEIYNIRYCEVFVSAYEPSHQQIFLEFGLNPRGYVPSWNYNQKTDKFEDCILFNWYEGDINNIRLLDEGKSLLESLGFQYSFEPKTLKDWGY